MTPLIDVPLAGNRDAGLKLLREGKLACLILAGGEGSRLGSCAPKGTFPVTLCKKKSLFQLFSERLLAASLQCGSKVPLAIMTSPLNHAQTVEFFNTSPCAKPLEGGLDFFEQQMLPLLDLNKEPLPFFAPDGNGGALKGLVQSGIFKKWRTRGIEHVHILLVDNALADPCDAKLLAEHVRCGNEWTVKCIEKEAPDEQVGALARMGERLHIVEYSDQPPEAAAACRLANTGMFCLSMECIERLHSFPQPIHLAKKMRQGRWVLKQEKFLFDLLPYAHPSSALCYPREQVFAPLKNREGKNSLSEVERALQRADRNQFFQITGIEPPDIPFELDPAFYYPTEALLKHWRGRSLPSGGGYTQTNF